MPEPAPRLTANQQTRVGRLITESCINAYDNTSYQGRKTRLPWRTPTGYRLARMASILRCPVVAISVSRRDRGS